jgi:hypothetical protein
MKNTFTREEVILLLEDMYEKTAESYDDYGRSDFSKQAVSEAKKFLEERYPNE